MKANGVYTRSIWRCAASPSEASEAASRAVAIIDQTLLPHGWRTLTLKTLEDAAQAIRTMQVRGAPLIGATAAYGVALALQESDGGDAVLLEALAVLNATRPTAVNLAWALARMRTALLPLPASARVEAAWREADAIADEDVAQNRAIGEHGLELLRGLIAARSSTLRLMTHCNAGWLATVDRGTALAPVYAAFDAGIDVHVLVSETRPRNQGLLTAWELAQQGIPHELIADNAAGFLLARGEVDAVIVGADRIAANGDVANKIGTFMKALAAKAAGIPFYVAAPRSTFDFSCPGGAAIPIEERAGDELRLIAGTSENPENPIAQLRLCPPQTPARNPAFDITPADCVTALICERGVAPASHAGIARLYPEFAHAFPPSSRANPR
ncbi:MAG: S-methyl-5-thioribose-1-phosphate isomerase [Betaproteobacteria bacterium]|nr:S-methyl-5-thioribose-1-phosphate isomerase [Betaproteobacteria bacterium]